MARQGGLRYQRAGLVRFSWRLRSATDRVLKRNRWLGGSLCALAALCAADVLLPPSQVTAPFVLYLIALGVPLALLHGACWALAFWLLRRRRAWVWLIWPALSLAAAGWLAWDLGALSRLHSKYERLAVLVLAACAGGGALFGLLCAALQPTRRYPSGWLLERGPRARRIVAAVLCAIVVALQLGDRRLYPNLYLDAHVALRLSSLWIAMIAVVVAQGAALVIHKRRWALVGLAYVLALCTLDQGQSATLDAFDARPWPAAVLAVNRRLWDWDQDGYSSLLGGSDCAPWNPRVHPGAPEIPENGIDDNCVLGDAKRTSGTFTLPAVPTQPAPLDVVLITADALNPAHLGFYNPAYGPSGRATSPNLDRWAQDATVFDRAYSPGGWTSIAIASLLHGVYPRRLHWRKYFETNLYALLRKPLAPKLRVGEVPLHMFPLAFSDPHPALAELLARRGMYCAAVVDDGYTGMLQPGTGIERGFNLFRQLDNLPPDRRDDAGTADTAIELLSRMPAQRRFFLWVHFFGTHWPDETHPGFRKYGERPEDLYDHEVVFLDAQLKRLLAALAARTQPPAVLIAADHSEGLTPLSRTHGQTLDENVIKIPLLARVPKWPARRVNQLVTSVDLVRTILALTNTPAAEYLDGEDLAPIVGGGGDPERVLFSDTWRFGSDESRELDFAAAYDGTRKFVLDRLSGVFYSASQVHPDATPRLMGSTPTDALSAAVYGYVEEAGGMQLSD